MNIDGTTLARRALAQYLLSVQVNERVTVARSTGWIEINKQPAFVLPSEITLARAASEQIILAGHIRAPYGQHGTLDGWRESIAKPGRRSLHAAGFVLATAFTGPLLMLGGSRGAALCICTAPPAWARRPLLRIAASVWGSGADGGYVRTWRTTANGLEGTLASASDTLLPLDELGQAEGAARIGLRRST